MGINRFTDTLTIALNKSMAADIATDAFNILKTKEFTMQFAWTGGSTPVGTFYLQFSNNGVNWDIDPDSIMPISGNSGSDQITSPTGPKFVQGYYSATSGSGTMTVTIVAKGWQ